MIRATFGVVLSLFLVPTLAAAAPAPAPDPGVVTTPGGLTCQAGQACTAPNQQVLQPPVDAQDHSLGQTGAAGVTLVAYVDFQCPYCAQLVKILKHEQGKYPGSLKVVYRVIPLPSHPVSAFATNAAEAAGAQGKYWEMFDWIFTHQQTLTQVGITEEARALGLDMSRWTHDMSSQAGKPHIDRDIGSFAGCHCAGTPTIFMNNKMVFAGLPPEAQLDQALAARIQTVTPMKLNLPPPTRAK